MTESHQPFTEPEDKPSSLQRELFLILIDANPHTAEVLVDGEPAVVLSRNSYHIKIKVPADSESQLKILAGGREQTVILHAEDPQRELTFNFSND